jgi:23S rRNA (pseudouridine1915-N3)-methyltransferase
MDEHGIGLSSKEFAGKLENLAIQGKSKVQFIIGGADGLPQSVRDRANFILSFGKQTWPHMLARVMLTEQIYRAQQIIAGHPYHRE